jgi:hypothetical protein
MDNPNPQATDTTSEGLECTGPLWEGAKYALAFLLADVFHYFFG